MLCLAKSAGSRAGFDGFWCHLVALQLKSVYRLQVGRPPFVMSIDHDLFYWLWSLSLIIVKYFICVCSIVWYYVVNMIYVADLNTVLWRKRSNSFRLYNKTLFNTWLWTYETLTWWWVSSSAVEWVKMMFVTRDSVTVYAGFLSMDTNFSFEGKYFDLKREIHKLDTPHSWLT